MPKARHVQRHMHRHVHVHRQLASYVKAFDSAKVPILQKSVFVQKLQFCKNVSRFDVKKSGFCKI